MSFCRGFCLQRISKRIFEIQFRKKKNIACEVTLFTEESLESEKQSLYDSKEGLKGVNSERLNKV